MKKWLNEELTWKRWHLMLLLIMAFLFSFMRWLRFDQYFIFSFGGIIALIFFSMIIKPGDIK